MKKKATCQALLRVGLSCNEGEEMLIVVKSGDGSTSKGKSTLFKKEWRRREFFWVWPCKSAFSGQLQPPCSSSQCCLVACVKSFVEQLRHSSFQPDQSRSPGWRLSSGGRRRVTPCSWLDQNGFAARSIAPGATIATLEIQWLENDIGNYITSHSWAAASATALGNYTITSHSWAAASATALGNYITSYSWAEAATLGLKPELLLSLVSLTLHYDWYDPTMYWSASEPGGRSSRSRDSAQTRTVYQWSLLESWSNVLVFESTACISVPDYLLIQLRILMKRGKKWKL